MPEARQRLRRRPSMNDVWLFIAGAIVGASLFFIVMGLPLGLMSLVTRFEDPATSWPVFAVVVMVGIAAAGVAGSLLAKWGVGWALVLGIALPTIGQPLLYAPRADASGQWMIVALVGFGVAVVLGYWQRRWRGMVHDRGAAEGAADRAQRRDAPQGRGTGRQ